LTGKRKEEMTSQVQNKTEQPYAEKNDQLLHREKKRNTKKKKQKKQKKKKKNREYKSKKHQTVLVHTGAERAQD